MRCAPGLAACPHSLQWEKLASLGARQTVVILGDWCRYFLSQHVLGLTTRSLVGDGPKVREHIVAFFSHEHPTSLNHPHFFPLFNITSPKARLLQTLQQNLMSTQGGTRFMRFAPTLWAWSVLVQWGIVGSRRRKSAVPAPTPGIVDSVHAFRSTLWAWSRDES